MGRGRVRGLVKRGAAAVRSMPTGAKVALGLAGAAGAVGIGAVAARAFRSQRRVRRGSIPTMKAKLVRRLLKIKLLQADRRLLREQLKGV